MQAEGLEYTGGGLTKKAAKKAAATKVYNALYCIEEEPDNFEIVEISDQVHLLKPHCSKYVPKIASRKVEILASVYCFSPILKFMGILFKRYGTKITEKADCFEKLFTLQLQTSILFSS